MTAETWVAETWIHQTLTGDATLMGLVTAVYMHEAPVGAVLPFALVTYHMGNDVRGVGPTIVAVDLEYVVRALTDQKSFQPIQAAADRIQTLLHAASGTAAGGTVLSSVRVRPFQLVETTDNRTEGAVSVRHLGAIYQVLTQGG